MHNLVEVEYAQTGKATNTDALGMREMQAMSYTLYIVISLIDWMPK